MRRKNLSLSLGIGILVAVAIVASFLVMQRTQKDTMIAKEKKQSVEKVKPKEKEPSIVEEKPAMSHHRPGEAADAGNIENHEERDDRVAKNREDKKSQNKKESETVPTSVTPYNFHSSTTMEWPVKGNVIISYNMENMIYFATLDEYRFSNFIAIEAEEGTEVKAGASGEVIKVENRIDTGLTVTMKVGPEYSIVYGQLKDCDLHTGDKVERGRVFARIGKVTPSYEKEGTHLYLQVCRGEESENPLSFLANS